MPGLLAATGSAYFLGDRGREEDYLYRDGRGLILKRKWEEKERWNGKGSIGIPSSEGRGRGRGQGQGRSPDAVKVKVSVWILIRVHGLDASPGEVQTLTET